MSKESGRLRNRTRRVTETKHLWYRDGRGRGGGGTEGVLRDGKTGRERGGKGRGGERSLRRETDAVGGYIFTHHTCGGGGGFVLVVCAYFIPPPSAFVCDLGKQSRIVPPSPSIHPLTPPTPTPALPHARFLTHPSPPPKKKDHKYLKADLQPTPLFPSPPPSPSPHLYCLQRIPICLRATLLEHRAFTLTPPPHAPSSPHNLPFPFPTKKTPKRLFRRTPATTLSQKKTTKKTPLFLFVWHSLSRAVFFSKILLDTTVIVLRPKNGRKQLNFLTATLFFAQPPHPPLSTPVVFRSVLQKNKEDTKNKEEEEEENDQKNNKGQTTGGRVICQNKQTKRHAFLV